MPDFCKMKKGGCVNGLGEGNFGLIALLAHSGQANGQA